MTPEQQETLRETLERHTNAKAAEFCLDPEKGRLAGYFPEELFRSFQETGMPRQKMKARSDRAAWLYGIARRDLAGWHWRVDEGMGPDDAVLKISI